MGRPKECDLPKIEMEKSLRIALVMGLRYRFQDNTVYSQSACDLWQLVLRGGKMVIDSTPGDMFAFMCNEFFHLKPEEYNLMKTKFFKED